MINFDDVLYFFAIKVHREPHYQTTLSLTHNINKYIIYSKIYFGSIT